MLNTSLASFPPITVTSKHSFFSSFPDLCQSKNFLLIYSLNTGVLEGSILSTFLIVFSGNLMRKFSVVSSILCSDSRQFFLSALCQILHCASHDHMQTEASYTESLAQISALSPTLAELQVWASGDLKKPTRVSTECLHTYECVVESPRGWMTHDDVKLKMFLSAIFGYICLISVSSLSFNTLFIWNPDDFLILI